MTSEVVLLISILCLIKCTWCENYGFCLGQRHSNDEILHRKLLTNNGCADEGIIEYTYIAEKPVSYLQIRTDTNIYSEVTFNNSNEIIIKLSNFEQLEFNATLTIYGFPFHPDGPMPDDTKLLLQPSKIIYLNKSSVEDRSIIATNGAYMSEEISRTKEESNGEYEIEDSSSSSSSSSSSTSEYYDYDFTSKIDKNIADLMPETIINATQNFEVMNQSVVIKFNFFVFISCVTIFVL